MEIVIFGAGSYASNLIKVIREEVEILAVVDNNPRRWGTKFNDINIISPNDLNDYQYSYICIASMYTEEIQRQLIDMGIDKARIISTYIHTSIGRNTINILNKIIDFSKAQMFVVSSEETSHKSVAEIIERVPQSIIKKLDIQSNQDDCRLFLYYKDEATKNINVYIF